MLAIEKENVEIVQILCTPQNNIDFSMTCVCSFIKLFFTAIMYFYHYNKYNLFVNCISESMQNYYLV